MLDWLIDKGVEWFVSRDTQGLWPFNKVDVVFNQDLQAIAHVSSRWESKSIKKQFPDLIVATTDWKQKLVLDLPGVVLSRPDADDTDPARMNIVPVNSEGYTLRDYP